MKLIFIVTDIWSPYMQYVNTNILVQPKRRCVEIELTEDQLKLLSLKKVGTNSGTDMYESIESISLLDEEK